VIKTWQERITLPESRLDKHDCMQAEIDELRAALAAKLVPMDENDQIEIMERLGITVYGPAAEAVEALIREVEAHHGIKEK